MDDGRGVRKRMGLLEKAEANTIPKKKPPTQKLSGGGVEPDKTGHLRQQRELQKRVMRGV